VNLEGTGIRLDQTGENPHERGLAGTVLAEERVDLALDEIEGHPVVGHDAAEAHGALANAEDRVELCGFG